jgi:hypothetical protein
MSDKPPSKSASSPPEARPTRGLKAVGLFSDRVAKPILGKRGLAEGDLLRQWSSIVGPHLARLSQPENVRFMKGRRDNGELTVRVGSGAAATLLQHEAARVIERVNRFFGYAALSRMKILQAPLPKRRKAAAPALAALDNKEETDLNALLAGVTDPELRAALESLGRSMIGRKKAQKNG